MEKENSSSLTSWRSILRMWLNSAAKPSKSSPPAATPPPPSSAGSSTSFRAPPLSSPTSEPPFSPKLAHRRPLSPSRTSSHAPTYRQIITGTLRAAAIVPISERVCIQDITLPRGGAPDGSKTLFIPKGQRILLCTHAMQHREDIWGEDSVAFRPERLGGMEAGNGIYTVFGEGRGSALVVSLGGFFFSLSFVFFFDSKH